MTDRPTPFDLVFGDAERARIASLRDALVASGLDSTQREWFVLDQHAGAWLNELRPDEGMGEGVAEFVAFLHASYRYWSDGEGVVELGRETLDRLLQDPRGLTVQSDRTAVYYTQLPAQRVWSLGGADSGPEPLDGCFIVPAAGRLAIIAVFGLYPGRPGFTVVEVEGPRPGPLARLDGSPLFAPTLPGGAAAGLYSLAGGEELLELGWRVHEQLGGGVRPGRQELVLA